MRENIRLIGQLSTVGLSFVLAIVMGFGGGYLLDGWLGTRPWLTFLGFFAGIAAGITNVYRVMKLANPSAKPASRDSPDRVP
jgi:ATP synthase protein I